jgi:hypothetical protein
LLAATPASAQLAPTGGHYAGRPSDTGYAGEVNSSGGYQAAVPLDWPSVRGGLPIPLQLSYRERGVGAAGAGWDVPLSYIRRDTTLARRRPAGTADVAPQAREQVTLVLEGQQLDLVRTAAGWVAQRDAPDLAIREQNDGTWVVFDGGGRTYQFTVAAPALSGVGLWHLAAITGPGGSKVALNYTVGAPTIAGTPDAASIDLASIQYNPDSTGCYKNTITLAYDAPAAVLSVALVGSKAIARIHKLTSISVKSAPSCGGTVQTLRAYQLSYLTDGDTTLPRLHKVQMTGRDGTPEATAPVPIATYSYGTATSGGQLTYQSAPTILASAPVTTLGTTGIDVAARPSERFGLSTSAALADFTGDGRADLATGFGLLPNLPTGASGQPMLAASTGFAIKPLETRTTDTTRYDQGRGNIEDDKLWRQLIDVDGDGRVDVIDAAEQRGVWTVHLNTPDPANPQNTIWVQRAYSTAKLAQYLRAHGLWSGDDYVPLSLRSSVRDLVYSVCAKWNGRQWFEYEDDFSGGSCPPGGHLDSKGPESTITQWELKDVNGDGYPDIVLGSSSLGIHEQLANLPKPVHPVTGSVFTTRTDSVQPSPGNQLIAMFNVAGVHLDATTTDAFSAPVVLRASADCGVARWSPLDGTHQQLACDLIDVNGDGILDLVNGSSVFLGTGALGGAGFFTPGATMTLPGALAIQTNAAATTCAPPATGATINQVRQIAGLRDVTGDGIPDYV